MFFNCNSGIILFSIVSKTESNSGPASCPESEIPIKRIENIHRHTKQTGQIINHADKQHQRNAADNPDQDLGHCTEHTQAAHRAKGYQKPERQGKQKGKQKQKAGKSEPTEQLRCDLCKSHSTLRRWLIAGNASSPFFGWEEAFSGFTSFGQRNR